MSRFGLRNTKAGKLRAQQVLELRADYATGNYTQRELALKYKLSLNSVGNIVRGVTWPEVPMVKSDDEILSEEAVIKAAAKASEQRMLARMKNEGLGFYDNSRVTEAKGPEYEVDGERILARLTADIAAERSQSDHVTNQLEELKSK